MSSVHRRKELAAIREAEEEARQAEEQRRAFLTLYERIEEIDDMHAVKEFLHWLTDKLGIEE